MDNKIKPTKHWLFDFDGTIVDSMKYCAKVIVEILDEYNVAYEKDIVNIVTPLGTQGILQYLIKIGLNLSPEEISLEFAKRLTPLYENTITEKRGVRRCLEKMKKCGYKLHILTASPHAWLDPCLKRMGLFPLFENVWSCDDFGKKKTDPEIYIAAAKKIGASVGEITFLDDNINAGRTAKLTGMRVVGVYDDSSKNDEKEIRKLANGYIYDFSELESLVCG